MTNAMTSISRAKNQTELIPIIESWLQTFESDDAAWACLEEHRVPSGPVLSPTETIDHEYYRGRGAVRTVHDEVVGELALPGFPLRFSEQEEYDPGSVPHLGEHNAAVLESVLSYDPTRIDRLTQAGVLVSKREGS